MSRIRENAAPRSGPDAALRKWSVVLSALLAPSCIPRLSVAQIEMQILRGAEGPQAQLTQLVGSERALNLGCPSPQPQPAAEAH